MSWHVEEDRIPLARLAGLALEILRDQSVGLAVDRIPPAPLAGLALEILRDQSVGLAVGRIPPAPLAELDDATAPGCCDNRLSRHWATHLTLALGPKWQVRQATRHQRELSARRWLRECLRSE
jgi:hypothetical protein